jgi:hypothetical protein
MLNAVSADADADALNCFSGASEISRLLACVLYCLAIQS